MQQKDTSMKSSKLIETKGYIVAGVSLLFSWLLFYSDSKDILNSFFAALMAAGITWMAYVIIRLVYLALKD